MDVAVREPSTLANGSITPVIALPAVTGPLCGFLVIDKPAGCTSHDCVSKARRALGTRKVGHGGTLDPAVTGVLPLAVGPATRLLPYLDGGKEYLGTIQLGLRTNSDDLSGEVLEQQDWPSLSQAELDRQLQPFRGLIQQRPPAVSAVHVDGERAHTRARRGEQLLLASRAVTIEQLDLMRWDPSTGQLDIKLRCSAGTYVRSLARDLGDQLGCGGALAQLRRTAALGFTLEASLPLEALGPETALSNPLTALAHLPQQRLSEEQWLAWTRGQRLPLEGPEQPEESALVMLRPDGSLAGMARTRSDGLLQPKLVFDAAG
ncbi:MAG: tRNA pseudouridine(55) synthase TruB [Prochlorococcaceae cyanobacterium]